MPTLRQIFLAVMVMVAALRAWAVSEPIQLPEFRVEGTLWRYAKAGEIEVLTRAPEARARAFVAALMRGQRLLPDFILEGASVPLQVILVDQAVRPPAGLHRLEREDASRSWMSGYTEFTGIKADVVVDGTHVLALNLAGVEEIWNVLVNHARQRVDARTPAFPAWFTRGLFGPCGALRGVIGLPRSSTLQLPRLVWPDPSAAPGTFPSQARELPDFETMFPAREQSRDLPMEAQWRRDFHAGLFARWSLFGPASNGRNRNGYWVFAELARRGQATQEAFRQCYEMDWPQACAEMRAYLRQRNTGVLEVRRPDVMADVPEAERMEFRDATPDEISRIISVVSHLGAHANVEHSPAGRD